MQPIEITSLTGEELEIYKNRNESQLFHYYEPKPGIFIAESPNVVERALAAGYEPISFLVEDKQWKPRVEALVSSYAVPVYCGNQRVLAEIIGYEMARGMLCAMRRRPYPAVEEICRGKSRVAVLDDIENPANVGAIFRSAAALGIEGILLTKGCSDPLYRRAARVSMGTVFQIPWTFVNGDYVNMLHTMDYVLVAMALAKNSVSIREEALHREQKLAIILGNEGEGLANETLARCDYIARIPMAHGVDSLNVAAASAVIFWELQKE